MTSAYRLAPALAARLVGLALVASAVVLLVSTIVVAAVDGSVLVLVVVAALCLLATAGLGFATRRVPVLTADESRYRVRWVRGAGTKAAAWRDVEDAVAASPAGVDCVVLRLRDGRTTSIPVDAVDADREWFAAEIRAHLSRGEGLRPL